MEAQSYLDLIFRPPELESFYQGDYNVVLKIWRQGDEFETMEFNSLPGFFTIQDLKRLLYERKKTQEYIPRFVFMGIPQNNPDRAPYKGSKYYPADFLWVRDKTESPILYSPLALMATTDARFVDVSGQWGVFKEYPHGGICLEEAPLVRTTEGQVVFHVFTLGRLLSSFQRPRPMSAADWNMRFAMYFPRVPNSGTPTPQDEKDMRDVLTYLKRRQQRIENLEGLLTTTATPEAEIKGIQRLRLSFASPENFQSTEMLFYSLPVNHRRPFLRLLKPTGEPINKLFTKDNFYPPRPDIEDPNLLRQWAQQEAPDATEDFMFSKILLREIRTSQKPLYATMRMYQDGSSDVVVLPLKQERILNVATDLGSFQTQLQEALDGTGASIENMELGDLTAVFRMELDQDDPKIDRAELERRLPCFSPFFQLTPVYTTELPQMMVRYKAVSNYDAEDVKEKKGNIQTYIQFLAVRANIKGNAEPPASWVPKIAEEFQISISEATEHLRNWVLKRSEFVIVNPTTDDIMEGNHPGIDVAIFENHPSYSFHIYGVNSPKHFARIIMLMRLMIGLSADQLQCSDREASEFEAAEGSLDDEANAEPPIGSAAARGAAAGPLNMNMGMNANFGSGLIDANLLEDIAEETAAPAAEEEEEEEEKAAPAPQFTEEEMVGRTSKDAPITQNFIISLLLKSDPELFDYARSPDVKIQPYSRKCQATMDAQPIVMNRQQFEKNYRMYKDQSIVFPLRGEKIPVLEKTEEVFTFMRYSSNPSLDLFLTCPPIFCVRDFMIIRRDDFKSSMGFDKKRKQPFTCPFCRGTVIEDKKKAVPDATVLVRPAKNHTKLKYDGRDKILQYIGFQSDDSHPKGLNFPCCFLKPQTTSGKAKQYTLTSDNPAFEQQSKWLREGLLGRLDMNTVVAEADAAAEVGKEDDTGDEEDSGTVAGTGFESKTKIRPFTITLNDLPNEYIQEANKHLLHGKIAILTKSLGDYFEQDSKGMVKVISSKQTLTPSAKGFLRIGVGNTPRSRPDSLLACLAPLLGKTHFSEVKALIKDRITPRVFLQLNYGNLVHEYFDPNDPEPVGEDGGETDVMERWAAEWINIKNNSANKMAISRFYRSYRRFISEIDSSTSRKQLRVFADILQQPGILYAYETKRCLLLVTLEVDASNPNTPIRVLCPPYGITPYARDNADIAFIVRYVGGDTIPYYEPLLYTENYAATSTTNAIHRYNFIFQRAAMRDWSNTVRVRVREFMDKCEGPGRQRYAPQSAIDPYAMISISQLKTFLGVGIKALSGRPLTVSAILRDSYNHVAGLLYQIGTHNRYVMVPCVDDGSVYTEGIPHIELDFEGFPPATVDEIVSFYNIYLRHRFNALYPGYQPEAQIRTIYDTRVSAVRLANGLIIPAQPAKKPVNLPEVAPLQSQIEWRINKAIADIETPAAKVAVAVAVDDNITIDHVNELYEHFRISFANWLIGESATVVNKSVNGIIQNPGLDNADKRKRLDILLHSTIEKWLDPDQGYEVTPFEFLRRDCISIKDDPSKCTGVCRWRETTSEEETKCRIHVPDVAGVKKINTVNLFCQRLYDELIRIPFKRNELLKNQVARLHPPVDAIYDEKQHQWILPDTSSDWITLKRLEWMSDEYDKPRYFEEMSSAPEEAKGSEFLKRLSPEMVAFLGEGAEKLYQWQPQTSDVATREPYIVFAPMLGFAFSEPDVGLERQATEITQEAATRAAKKSGKLLIFANFSKNSFIVGRPAATQQIKSYTIFLEQEGQIPSLIVSSPRSSGIPLDDLPSIVKTLISKTSKPLMMRRTVAPAATT